MRELGVVNTYTPVFTGSTGNPSGGVQTNAIAIWSRYSNTGVWLSLSITYLSWTGGSGTIRISIPSNITAGGFTLFDFVAGLPCIVRSGATTHATFVRIDTTTTLRFLKSDGTNLLWSDVSSVNGFTICVNQIWPIHIPI